jgi:hypothetical protein
MSERDRITQTNDHDQERPQGPSLVLMYSLIALGLLIAIALAALIVWPFYKAR